MPQWIFDADDIIRTGQQRECARPSTFAISRIGQHSDRDLLRRAKAAASCGSHTARTCLSTGGSP